MAKPRHRLCEQKVAPYGRRLRNCSKNLIRSAMYRRLLPLLLFVPSVAFAQWPTTEWHVQCRPETLAEIGQERCDELAGDFGFARTTLEHASQFFSDERLRPPDIVRDDLGRYLAWIDDENVYTPETSSLELDWADLLVEENAVDMATELVFAIQHNSMPHHVWIGDEYQWLLEGSAIFAAVQATRTSVVIPPPMLSDPLHITRSRDHDERTAMLWKDLGTQYERPLSGIEYLHHVYQADLEPNRGLTGLHEALQTYEVNGLYDYYPEFIARITHAPELEHRVYFDNEDGAYEFDEWPYGAATGVVERIYTGTMNPVAAHAYDIEISSAGEGPVSVTVRLEGPRDALHLSVDKEMADEYNVYESILTAGRDTLAIRIANISPRPASSVEQPYTLRVILDRLETCSDDALRAALNPYSPRLRAEVRTLMARWQGMQLLDSTGTGMTTLGQAQYSFNGDGGMACVSYFGVSDVEWMHQHDPDPPDAEATLEEIIARNMPRAVRETGLTEAQIRMLLSGRQPPGVTGADMRRLMEVIQEIAAEPQSATAEASGVYFHIFEPNLATALVGIAPERLSDKDLVATRHNGLSGWRGNSASNLIVYLPGTQASEIEAGGTYNAVAYSLSDDPLPTTVEGPETNSAFYTWWNGDWETYRCDGEQQEDFVGTQETIWGHLTGTVRIESVSRASVRGSFDLAGSGQQETITYTLEPTDHATCRRAPEVEDDLVTISVSASGSFVAPNFAGIGSFGVAGVGRAVRVGR